MENDNLSSVDSSFYNIRIFLAEYFSICSRPGPSASKGSCVFDNALETFFKPIEPDKDDESVYENGSRKEREDINYELDGTLVETYKHPRS